MKLSSKIALIGIIAITLVGNLFAQEFRGTIAGTVTDPNGSVIPDATVVIKNIDTNIETTLKTNEAGAFVAPLLIPGKYSVLVTANGFKKTLRDQVNLNVGDRLSVDFALEIGAESQQVSVVADAELIERGSVTTGTVVSAQQIEELPLSEGAAYNLALQAPGVSYEGNPLFTGPTSNGNLAAFRTNGVGGNQITLDGSPNFAFDGAVAYTPPSDAVSQFKIQTSAFDAQNGFSAGSTVNVAVKSGTNKFHGSGSYFDRSKPFTANNFFSNKAKVEKSDRHYYRYGGQVNGPIIKDRTFFMVAYEHQYNKVAAPALYSVPTDKMKTGDFSELLASGIIIYDPTTAVLRNSTCGTTGTQNTVCRTAFAGNIIPTAKLNQGALNFLKLYPSPNLPGFTNNYFSNTTNILPYSTVLTRIDHNINDNQRVFGKFFWSQHYDDKFNILETDDAFTRGLEYRTNLGGNIGYTANISSSLIFDLRGNYNQLEQERVPVNPRSSADLGLTGIAAISDSKMAPRFNFTNYTTWGPQRSDYNEGLTRRFSELSAQPSFTQIVGDHTLRYGYDYRRLFETRTTNGNNAGNFTTTGTFVTQASAGTLITTNSSINGAGAVGRDIASFLLGITTSGTLDKGVKYDVYSTYQGFFIQDDWRVTQKLNLNLGLRFEVESGLREKNGQIVVGYNPTIPNWLQAGALTNYNANVPNGIPITAFQNLVGGLIFADNYKTPQQSADKNNFQPRIGASYAINEKTVIRGGFGIFTAPFQLSGITAPLVQTGFTPSTTFLASSDNGLTFAGTLNNPFPTGLNPATGSALGLVTAVGTTLGTVGSTGPSASVLPYDRKNANSIRGVLGIQREMPWKIGLEATAVYSHGKDLAVFNQLNYIPAQYLNNLAGVTDFTTITNAIATTSAFLTATVPNPFRGLVPTNSTWNANTLARNRLLTANPQFQDLVTRSFDGSSDYASLQLQAVKRFDRGLSLNATYTFSYDHEKVRKLNPQDTKLTDMISTGSRPHRVTFSGIYELPFGKKKWIGNNWNGWVNTFLGGWQLQAIYEWQSGTPLVLPNVYYNGDPTKLKNLVGQSDSQGRKYGVDIPAFDTSGFLLTNPATGALTVPAFGNNYSTTGANTMRYMPYTLNNFRSQFYQKFDAGLTKNFTLREGMKLQVRIEGINALNWVNFDALNLTPSVGATSTFGFSTAQRNLPRDIQLGARFTF
ncbi:MAG TPA: TonB-dependent receptor [Pyrinomonadaceae bacterium]|nr:TonB-dependent receptor [Pyrinomonadaceae bacterium]